MYASTITMTLAVLWLSSQLSTPVLYCPLILTAKKKMNGWVLGGDRATAARPRRQDTQLAKASTARARGNGSQQGLPTQQRLASDNILTNTAKLALSTAKQVRQLTCAVRRTLSIPTASPLGPKFQVIPARDLPWRDDQLLYTWGILSLVRWLCFG